MRDAAHEQTTDSFLACEAAPRRAQFEGVGDVAVLSVRMQMSGSFKGAEFAGAFRHARVWCLRGEEWRIVASHVSAVQG